jgi:hypothetical protein
MYEAESFAPLGLYLPSLVADRRLVPWAAFLRRFAASLISRLL